MKGKKYSKEENNEEGERERLEGKQMKKVKIVQLEKEKKVIGAQNNIKEEILMKRRRNEATSDENDRKGGE